MCELVNIQCNSLFSSWTSASAAAPTPSPRARSYANPEVFDDALEVRRRTLPHGHTDRLNASLLATRATEARSHLATARGNARARGSLQAWRADLAAAASTYAEHRAVLAGRLVETQNPRRRVCADRLRALAEAHQTYTQLAAEARAAAALSGPTAALIELADLTYRELITALEASGHTTRGPSAVDSARVRAEARNHLQALRLALCPDHAGAIAPLGASLRRAHTELGEALFAASAAVTELRACAASAQLDAADDLDDLADWADSLLAALAQHHLHPAARSDAHSASWPLCGDPLGTVARHAHKLQSERCASLAAPLAQLESTLRALDLAFGHFTSQVCQALPSADQLRAARVATALTLDDVARARVELGPNSEYHAPIADRLARLELAATLIQLAQGAAGHLIERLLPPASKAELLALTPTEDPELHTLRARSPANCFRGALRSVAALRDELSSRAALIQGLVMP